MDEQQPSQIFGLNFLQDDKSEPDEITGAYDPEQELWLNEVRGGVLHNGVPAVFDGRSGSHSNPLPFPGKPSMSSEYTEKRTWYRTNTGGGRDKDSNSDFDDD
jgi:hypothetical protein